MTIACFISGSGTNYREIANRDPNHDYIVFTNRPGCDGVSIARENKHPVIELSHAPYLKAAKKKYSPGMIPRNCPERIHFEQEVCRQIEAHLGRQPHLICLAGYDQWLTDWTVEKYYPRILNVHPGDITRGYDGLHWVPAARAILAGEKTIRSTLFFVDKGEDSGPVLIQSKPLNIKDTLTVLETRVTPGLHEGLKEINEFAAAHNIHTLADFSVIAGKELSHILETICLGLQDALKVAGDWKIYPYAVHDLISQGRVEIEGRAVYVDGQPVSIHGYQINDYRC
jgi:phosphoribosylglycinamide formyltransferase 1